MIWGDYAYGFEGDEYNADTQYGGRAQHRADELWGDDDIIYGGDGEGTANQMIWAGDGDDTIFMGDTWNEGSAYGGDGNDVIYSGDNIAS